MRFENFGLIEPLLKGVRAAGYVDPTPVQIEAMPHVLKGKDLLGCAQTGTGKTAAFALPILQRLCAHPHRPKTRRPIRALVITPTRELARQIAESFKTYGRYTRLRCTVVYGGVRQGPQAKALNLGVDILVATPGRLLDLMGQKIVKLARVEVLVLDEADRMLDMGFIPDVRRIVAAVPEKRQTLFFSATMPQSIQHLADEILTRPVEVRVRQDAPAAETVVQWLYLVEPKDKLVLLQHLLKHDESVTRALVFMRTKRQADRVTRHLKYTDINAEALHSDKAQTDRQKILAGFKRGAIRVLVASDIAARGLDVDNISHVVNFDMPHEPEMYIHRIGRTGRAGAAGVAWSFCSLGERTWLDQIERLIRKPITLVKDHPFPSAMSRKTAAPAPRGRRLLGRRRRRLRS